MNIKYGENFKTCKDIDKAFGENFIFKIKGKLATYCRWCCYKEK